MPASIIWPQYLHWKSKSLGELEIDPSYGRVKWKNQPCSGQHYIFSSCQNNGSIPYKKSILSKRWFNILSPVLLWMHSRAGCSICQILIDTIFYRYRYFAKFPYRYRYFQEWPYRYQYFSNCPYRYRYFPNFLIDIFIDIDIFQIFLSIFFRYRYSQNKCRYFIDISKKADILTIDINISYIDIDIF